MMFFTPRTFISRLARRSSRTRFDATSLTTNRSFKSFSSPQSSVENMMFFTPRTSTLISRLARSSRKTNISFNTRRAFTPSTTTRSFNTTTRRAFSILPSTTRRSFDVTTRRAFSGFRSWKTGGSVLAATAVVVAITSSINYEDEEKNVICERVDESPFSMYAKCEMKILRYVYRKEMNSNPRTKHIIHRGNSHPELAKNVADCLGVELSEAEIKSFNNGETAVTIADSVRDCDVFVIQSTCFPQPNDNIVELCIMVDALRRAGAARITVVMPHYAYARNSFKNKSRTPIVSKLIADMLETTGVDRVVTIDLHSSQIQGFATYPIDNLDGLPTLRNYLLRLGVFGDDVVVVASSPHGAKMAESLSKQLGSGFALNSKVRERGNISDHPVLVGEVRDKTCVCLVDIIDTGETLCRTSHVCKEAGAETVIGAAIHGIFSDRAIQDLEESDIDKIVVMDTVPCVDRCQKSEKITVLSSANLLAHAIWRIHMGGSLSQLYRFDSAAHVARPLRHEDKNKEG